MYIYTVYNLMGNNKHIFLNILEVQGIKQRDNNIHKP